MRWLFPFTWTSGAAAPSITTTVSAEVVVMLDYAGATTLAKQVNRETTI